MPTKRPGEQSGESAGPPEQAERGFQEPVVLMQAPFELDRELVREAALRAHQVVLRKRSHALRKQDEESRSS